MEAEIELILSAASRGLSELNEPPKSPTLIINNIHINTEQ